MTQEPTEARRLLIGDGDWAGTAWRADTPRLSTSPTSSGACPLTTCNVARKGSGTTEVGAPTFNKAGRRVWWFDEAAQSRLIELAGLVDAEGQQQLRESFEATAGKKGALNKEERRKVEAELAAHTGNLTIAEAWTIANRYALWFSRNKFDWRKGVPPEVRELDGRICGGVTKLDVEIRRECEQLVLGTPNVAAADSLRSRAEAEAWQFATDLDTARGLRERAMAYWSEIFDQIGAVLIDLDKVLTLAGSSPQGRSASLTRTGWFHVTWPPNALGAWFLVEPGGIVRSSWGQDPGLPDDLPTSILVDFARDELREALGSAPLSPNARPQAAFTWSPPLPGS